MVKIKEINESTEVLKEVAFVPALFYALAAAGSAYTAVEAFIIYKSWQMGLITDQELVQKMGPKAAEIIMNFGAAGVAVKGTRLGWNAFKKAWNSASKKGSEVDPKDPRYNPITKRTDPPLTSKEPRGRRRGNRIDPPPLSRKPDQPGS